MRVFGLPSTIRPATVRLATLVLLGCACQLLLVPCRAAASGPHSPSDDAIDRTLAKVVKIFGAGGVRNLEAYGTGFLVSPNGHIVTVWSHLLDAGDVNVDLNDGRRFAAKFVKGDARLDLAVLQIEGDEHDLPYFDLHEIADALPGTRVLGYSNMFKVATGDEPVSVVHGVVAACSRLAGRRGAYGETYDAPVYIVDATTNNPGAAGGALTTLDGRLVGMIGRELRNAESNTWVNYAVPLKDLRKTIEDIVAGRYVPPPKPPEGDAPRFTPLDLGLVMVPDVVYRTPAYVESVIPESAAARAAIAPEDLIVFVNDELVQSNRALKSILARLEAGDSIHVVLRRKDKLVPLELHLPDRRGK
jgi:serine protease Do